MSTIVPARPTPLEEIGLDAFGLLTANYWPLIAQNTFTPTSQKIHFGAVPVRAGMLISNIHVWVTTAAVGTDPTTVELALLSTAGARLAVTADVVADAQWDTIGVKSFPLGTPYTVTETGLLHAAILKDGAWSGTDVVIARATGGNASVEINSVFPYGNYGTGQTAIGATETAATDTTMPWFGLS